jgi:hypothetical protein
MKESAGADGKLVGASAGEGFVQHLGSGYPHGNILKVLLGDLCVERRDRQ